jgi:hypothetical protein
MREAKSRDKFDQACCMNALADLDETGKLAARGGINLMLGHVIEIS